MRPNSVPLSLDEALHWQPTEAESRAIQRSVLEALRPSFITPEELPVPEHASRVAQVVALAIISMTNDRLADGWSLHHCLESSALGRDQIVRQLQMLGQSLDRKTVAAGLRELTKLGVLTRVGQADHWTDLAEQDASRVFKSGAFLYELHVQLRNLGSEGLAQLLHISATLGGITGSRRGSKALKWAVENAKEGCRNAIGFWLANRCKDAGLTEGDAQGLIREYAASVNSGNHPYTLREALLSLHSAYK